MPVGQASSLTYQDRQAGSLTYIVRLEAWPTSSGWKP